MCVGEVRGRGPREMSDPRKKTAKNKTIPLICSSSSSHGLHILLIWLLTGLLIWLLIWLLTGLFSLALNLARGPEFGPRVLHIRGRPESKHFWTP